MTLHTCFENLLYSWGSDTPPEAIWSANEILEYLSQKHPELKDLTFIEDDQDGHNEKVLETIKTLGI